MPPTLESFIRHSPHAELIVREDTTASLLPAVVEGELDLALVALPLADPHLETEALVTEPLLLAMPPGHPLARRKRVTVRDLASERFILLGEMHCLAEQVLNFCRAHECQPLIACKSAQITTIQQLIALGQGRVAVARRGPPRRHIGANRLSPAGRPTSRSGRSASSGTGTTFTARWRSSTWGSCGSGPSGKRRRSSTVVITLRVMNRSRSERLRRVRGAVSVSAAASRGA